MTIDSLPPPPTDGLASLSRDPDKLRIELKPIFAPWTKVVYAASFPIMILAFLVDAFIIGTMFDAHGFPFLLISLCIPAAILTFASMFALSAGITLPTLYGLIVCDGRTLFITDVKSQFIFPVDQIRAIRLVILKQLSQRCCPERPPAKFFRIAPAAALEIETPQGRSRLLRRWEIEDLQWLDRVLNLYLAQSLPPSPTQTSPLINTLITGTDPISRLFR